jgi:hypothetical protein
MEQQPLMPRPVAQIKTTSISLRGSLIAKDNELGLIEALIGKLDDFATTASSVEPIPVSQREPSELSKLKGLLLWSQSQETRLLAIRTHLETLVEI